jgi:predicted RNase H-like HicB family nuclease
MVKTMATAILSNNSEKTKYEIGGTVFDPKSYRCHFAIIKDDETGFSVLVLNLPGAGSSGETEEEAVENAKQAAIATIESYLADGEEIPWVACDYDIPAGAKLKWVLVDA